MILGKRDKKLVQDMQDTIIEYSGTIERLDAKVKEKNNKVTALKASLEFLMDFDAIHEQVGISYTDMAKVMGISITTLSKYRKGELELTPTKYQELLFELMNHLRIQ